MCVCMHEITISERDHKFEKEQGMVYGRVWREEQDGRNNYIIISIIK